MIAQQSTNKNNINYCCNVCNSNLKIYISKTFDDRYGYPKYYDVFICEKCGAFTIYPPLKKEEVVSLYTSYYPKRKLGQDDVKAAEAQTGILFKISRWFYGNHRIHMDFDKGKGRVLEIGCGEGRSLVWLKSLGYDAFGIDVDEDVEKIKDSLGLNIHIGTVEDAPFEKKSFDYIIANQLIEHVTDFKSFFDSCISLLKDDGIIILSTPNANSIYRKLFKKRWINWHIPYHQTIFNKKSMEILLEKNWLKLAKIKVVTPTKWTLHQIFTLKQNPKIGIKNPYWNKEESNDKNDQEPIKTKSNKKTLVYSLKMFVFKIGVFFISLANRFIDLFGRGDCIIFYIKKKK